MERKNIAFCLRMDYDAFPGGDTIQMETWRTVLRRLGHEVNILKSPVDPAALERADMVFIWHLERMDETFPLWRMAKERDLPIVLVPTYWHRGKRFPGFSLFKHAELVLRLAYNGFRNPWLAFRPWSSCRRQLLDASSSFIVNSEAERDLLVSEGANAAKVTIIPNVIDSAFFTAETPMRWEERSGVVCVGHFCPRKNQLGLIRALRGTDFSVTFIGGSRPMHRRYMRRCIAEAEGRHRFLGRISHAETINILKKSRFSISASFAETPGISNLEAAAAGCGLIVPDLRTIREYFTGELVSYIAPGRIDMAAVRRAMTAVPKPELREHVLGRYTDLNLPSYWEKFMSRGILPCGS